MSRRLIVCELNLSRNSPGGVIRVKTIKIITAIISVNCEVRMPKTFLHEDVGESKSKAQCNFNFGIRWSEL
jgi:hypothetical protein